MHYELFAIRLLQIYGTTCCIGIFEIGFGLLRFVVFVCPIFTMVVIIIDSMKGDEPFKSIRCARLQFAQGAIIAIIVDCRRHRHHGRASATALPPCAPSFVLRVKQDWKKSSLY